MATARASFRGCARTRKRYDAVIVNGLWNFTSFAAQRALGGADTRYFVYTHGMLDPYFNKAFPVKAAAKQLLWWFSEGRLVNNATGVMFVSEEERQSGAALVLAVHGARAGGSLWHH